MKTRMFWLLAIGLPLFSISCQKERSGQPFTVRLTDAPYDAQEVNVDIREVVVKYASDSSGWQTLDTRAGVYNLLELQNGVDTLLASGYSPDGSVKELRLILGSDNTIKIDDEVYPLTVPSGSETGLKIKVNKQLSGILDSLIVDFDAGLSVVRTGNGEYKLKPVLKLK